MSTILDHMRLALRQSLEKQWYDDKMRQEQLSALAHDLKTPLTIIRGNAELLFDTSADGNILLRVAFPNWAVMRYLKIRISSSLSMTE